MNQITNILKTYKLKQSSLPFVTQTINQITPILQLFPFKHHSAFISFNGGKDATAILYLILICQYLNQIEDPIKIIYFEEINSFPEVDQFIHEQVQSFGIEVIKLQRNFQKELKNLQEQFPYKAIYMGTRKTDPYSENLSTITMSDCQNGYPPFLRINPILDWSYAQVWKFLRELEIPYCSLYDQGYTYLGNRFTSQRNPCLQDGNNYKPAYEAEECEELQSRYKVKDKIKIVIGLPPESQQFEPFFHVMGNEDISRLKQLLNKESINQMEIFDDMRRDELSKEILNLKQQIM